MAGGVQTLVSTGLLGGGTKCIPKLWGWAAGPAATTPPPPHTPLFLRLWTVYFNWEGGEFYLFYWESQFYDLRSFLPFNWKKMKNCVMLDWLILATLL